VIIASYLTTKRKRSYMIEQQFLRSFADFSLGIFALAAAGNDGAALEGRGPAVEDKDRLGAEEQKLANASEKAKQMGVANHFTLLVAHRFHKLHHPYARICNLGEIKKKALLLDAGEREKESARV